MATVKTEIVPVRSAEDIVGVRRDVRAASVALGFSLVNQTKLVTAASEIARNTLDYGGGGDMRLETLQEGSRVGIKLVFVDQGPGIADLKLALTDGYTSGSGLGLGLTGAKRLCSEFDIQTEQGKGTTVTLVRWK